MLVGLGLLKIIDIVFLLHEVTCKTRMTWKCCIEIVFLYLLVSLMASKTVKSYSGEFSLPQWINSGDFLPV